MDPFSPREKRETNGKRRGKKDGRENGKEVIILVVVRLLVVVSLFCLLMNGGLRSANGRPCGGRGETGRGAGPLLAMKDGAHDERAEAIVFPIRGEDSW